MDSRKESAFPKAATEAMQQLGIDRAHPCSPLIRKMADSGSTRDQIILATADNVASARRPYGV